MIILFGAPGAGKTIQGQLLVKKYHWQWISSRSLMLSLRDKDISLALNYGMNIDDEKNIQLLSKNLKTIDFSSGKIAILDGFPNSVNQIYWLIENHFLPHIKGAIVLRVPRGELWKRLTSRGRADDTRVAIERRQSLYDRAIHGMIHVLKANNVRTAEVDGGNSPEDVLERIEELLGQWEIIPKKNYPKC